ncbi:MAG: prolipoprotein diacylglyceryl transferase, partial [Candidatus Marinimicrobia bacterium]|nr:prolipoprotein diacylglyceryl transferase [Candidatus Neomarinimicrobiota bacterium]
MMSLLEIDPIIFQIGPLAIRWYGLMYLFGFGAAFLLITHLSRLRDLPLTKDGVSDLLFYG